MAYTELGTELQTSRRQFLVAGALLYEKKTRGKPNYYNDNTERYAREEKKEASPWYAFDLSYLDETPERTERTFSEQILEIIDLGRKKDSDICRECGIDRRTFSKIVNAPDYIPSKDICLALCFTLKVGEERAHQLLKSAGYFLSHEDKRDLYIEYLFQEGLCSIAHVNEVLRELKVSPITPMGSVDNGSSFVIY